MNCKTEELQPYLTIPATELRFMAADAYRWGETETGGALYGLWSHAGRPGIMLATPAGRRASRETMHFAQDPDYLVAVNRQLQDRFGIQYLGNWHSHHSLAMDHPSGGDVEQIHRVAAKNNIPRMVQIVITRQEDLTSGHRPNGPTRTSETLLGPRIPFFKADTAGLNSENTLCPLSARMRINAFIYENATKGSYRRCPIKLLSEPSPIRAALDDSEVLSTAGVDKFSAFPLERIVYDRMDSSIHPEGSKGAIPSFLAAQIEDLPDEVTEQIEIFVRQGMLVVSMPLTRLENVVVAYGRKGSSHRICSVCVVRQHTKQVLDITARILADRSAVTLSTIYRSVKDKIHHNTAEPVAKPCKSKAICQDKTCAQHKLVTCLNRKRRPLSCGQKRSNIV